VIRPAEHLVHGINGPFVVIDGQVCAILDQLLSLDKVYRHHRGRNEQFDQSLTAIRLAAAAYTQKSCRGPDPAPQPDIASHSQRQHNTTVSTSQAATMLGITDRSVRRLIQQKRLPATCFDGRYRLHPDDVKNYRGART
jgi:excisionase family DNA binding protein